MMDDDNNHLLILKNVQRTSKKTFILSSWPPLFNKGCAAVAAGAAATGAAGAGAAPPLPTFPTIDSGAYLPMTSGG